MAKNTSLPTSPIKGKKKKLDKKRTLSNKKTSVGDAFKKAPKPKGGQMGYPTYGV